MWFLGNYFSYHEWAVKSIAVGLGALRISSTMGTAEARNPLQHGRLRDFSRQLKRAEKPLWPHKWPQAGKDFDFRLDRGIINQNWISGCGSTGRARHLGCRGWVFKSPHSDQIRLIILIRKYLKLSALFFCRKSLHNRGFRLFHFGVSFIVQSVSRFLGLYLSGFCLYRNHAETFSAE